MNKKPVCTVAKKPKKHKVCLTNFRILLILIYVYVENHKIY